MKDENKNLLAITLCTTLLIVVQLLVNMYTITRLTNEVQMAKAVLKYSIESYQMHNERYR